MRTIYTLLPCLLLATTPFAMGQTRNYIGPTNGNIATLANWDPNTPAFPGTATTVFSGITLQWNGTTTGNLLLTSTGQSVTSFDFLFTGNQTSSVAIANAANDIRIRNLTVDSGAGPVTLGNATNGVRIEGVAAGTPSVHTANVWTNNSANTVTITGPVNNSGGIGNKDLQIAGTGNWLLTDQIVMNASGNEVIIASSGTVSLTATAAPNFIAPVRITGGGVLQVVRLANGGGQQSSIGASTSNATNLRIESGTLRYQGVDARSTDRLFQIGNNVANSVSTLENTSANATHTISFTNTGAITYGTTDQTRTLRLGGTNTGNNTLAAQIQNNGSANVSVEKIGTGTWILTNSNNTYAGATTVTAGTLVIGTGGSMTNTSGIIVSAGATINNANGASITRGLTLAEGAAVTTSAASSGFAPTSLTLTGNLSDGWTAIALTNTAGGGLTKGGALTLTLTGITVGNYSLTSGSGYSGSFLSANVNGTALGASGSDWTGDVGAFTYSYTNSSNLLTVAVIPEPSTWALLAFSLTAVVVLRRRK